MSTSQVKSVSNEREASAINGWVMLIVNLALLIGAPIWLIRILVHAQSTGDEAALWWVIPAVLLEVLAVILLCGHFTLQPNEGFDLRFEVKVPGQLIRLAPQTLRFRYAEAFAPLAEAYETLLLDVMLGDQTLFVSANWVEASWRLYTPLLDSGVPTRPYAAGTWGPPGTPDFDAL